MQQIDVLFPPVGDPTVHEDCHAVMQGELIMWKVRSENPAVEKVRIEFSDGDPEPGFFPIDGARVRQITRGLSWVSPSRAVGAEAGRIGFALVWAQAPEIVSATPPRKNKYTVLGIDAAGAVVAKLDPQIITEHP